MNVMKTERVVPNAEPPPIVNSLSRCNLLTTITPKADRGVSSLRFSRGV